MSKPGPKEFMKYFKCIEGESIVFDKKLLKYFPSRRKQAEEWAILFIKAAIQNQKENLKKRK